MFEIIIKHKGMYGLALSQTYKVKHIAGIDKYQIIYKKKIKKENLKRAFCILTLVNWLIEKDSYKSHKMYPIFLGWFLFSINSMIIPETHWMIKVNKITKRIGDLNIQSTSI